MNTVTPLQNFVLVQFVSEDGKPSPIIFPDGAKNPGSKIIVLAVGPDVPATPALAKDTVVILRGDSRHFEAGPGSEALQIALVDHRSIIGIVETQALDQTLPLPFEQEVAEAIDGMAPSVATAEAQIEALRHG